jgi:glycosyltransferase involved in cell wall biosynthesis
MKQPVITYITVVRNGVEKIEETIRSILPYVSDKVEYLIVDGDSNDGTKEKIRLYENKLTGWISEKDTGIYDAMNKGIRKAKGSFICFINIGDRLLNCPLEQLENAGEAGIAAVSFPVSLSSGKTFRPSFSSRIRFENTLHHQGTYYRAAQNNEYNTAFRTFADFDMAQKLYKAKAKVIIDNSIINAFHDLGGVSNNKEQFDEIFTVIGNNFGPANAKLARVYFKLKYGLLRKLKIV